jgi:HSP20 family protein
MSLVRYNTALNDFVPTSFSNLIDRFFADASARSGGSAYSFVPRVDVFENENDYQVHVAVPGMKKEDFTLNVKENLLTVSGERKLMNEKTEKNFYSVETQYGTFSRSFSLPEHINAEAITARYVDGILEIKLPKDEKKTLKTNIKVN